MQSLATMAWTWRSGRPLIGYESGAKLAAGLRVGFKAVGQLRVWHRAGERIDCIRRFADSRTSLRYASRVSYRAFGDPRFRPI